MLFERNPTRFPYFIKSLEEGVIPGLLRISRDIRFSLLSSILSNSSSPSAPIRLYRMLILLVHPSYYKKEHSSWILLSLRMFPMRLTSHIPSRFTSFSGTSPLRPQSHMCSSLFIAWADNNLPINPPDNPSSLLNDKSNIISDFISFM